MDADFQKDARFRTALVWGVEGRGRLETDVRPEPPGFAAAEMTPSLNRSLLERCYELAAHSPCVKAKYGSLIWHPGLGRIVGEGWNHPPNPACLDCGTLCAGGIRNGVASGTRLELCHSVHAEQAAIIDAGRDARGGFIYVAGFDREGNRFLRDRSLPLGNPRAGFYCTLCIRCIWEAGIAGIMVDSVDGHSYETLEEAWRTSYAVAQGA